MLRNFNTNAGTDEEPEDMTASALSVKLAVSRYYEKVTEADVYSELDIHKPTVTVPIAGEERFNDGRVARSKRGAPLGRAQRAWHAHGLI